MTDNEIIKALERCNDPILTCEGCPLEKAGSCLNAIKIYTLDLINRQKAEIERQKRLFDSLGEFSDSCMGYTRKLTHEVKTAKAEAIKEFAEGLKLKVDIDLCEAIECSDYLYNLPKLIDNLVKEMTEDKP